jgi:fatty-acyl-CoA synthase
MTANDLAVRSVDGAATYGELAALVDAFAARLGAAGVRSGDRIGFSGPAGVAYLTTLFGTLSVGGAFVPVNPGHPPEIARAIVDDAEPRLLVLAGDSSVRSLSVAPDVAVIDLDADPIVPPDPAPRDAPGAGGGTDPFAPEPVGPDDLALLAYTSGSTGRPKGVMLSHANLTWNALNIAACADFRARDGVVVGATFYRMGGLAIVLQAILRGGVVEVPPSVDGGELLRTVVERRSQVVFTGTQQLRAMTDDPAWPDADLSSLRFAFVGGSPVDEPVARRFADRGVPVVAGYGLTVGAPMLLFADGRDALERPGSAGAPPPFVDVAIVGDDGRPVADGAVGEVIARGPNVMAGYWRRPQETAAKLRDGWLRTGDFARRDADGGLRIVGRAEDAIATKAGPVFGGEVERIVGAEPGVAAATAVPIDGIDGQRVGVVVVPSPGVRPDPAALADLLAADPRLAGAVVALVDAIPTSAAGKPIPSAVRALLAGALDSVAPVHSAARERSPA